MKKIVFILAGLQYALTLAQFNINISADLNLNIDEAYIYELNGSSDVIVTKQKKKNNQWSYKYPKNYSGMMKVYFPQSNFVFNFVSENKDVSITIKGDNQKANGVIYNDEANKLMDKVQDEQRKKESILPALYQMKQFYTPSSDFYQAMDKEISQLSQNVTDTSSYPFIDFYSKNYSKFLLKNNSSSVNNDEIIQFISNSSEFLETSTLLNPILIKFLQNVRNEQVEKEVDRLLTAINVESQRGQNVLSELIDIFDKYSLNDLKSKYLSYASNLKCTINNRLSSTIEVRKKTEVGAILENYTFAKPIHTTAKSIHDVKADKKIIVFWSSTCGHCERELPEFIPIYETLKKKNIEIIGLSFDSDKTVFEQKASLYPWINDSELKGWYSSVAEKYNVTATPTYFVLDANNKIIAKPDHLKDVLVFLGVNK